MKFLGHPIHLMLVHFPAALFPFEFACAVLGFFIGDKTLVSASFYAMAGGVILGWAAVAFGSLDILKVLKENPAAVKTAVLHGCVNTCVIIAYTVLAYSQYKNYPSLKPDGMSILIFKAVILSFMGFGNYLGGSLILKYRVAVEND